MTAEPGTRSYYIDDFADEVVPCDPSLAGWSAWLARGGSPGWPVNVPEDGQEFRTCVTHWQDDVIATRDQTDGSWEFSRSVPDGTFLAVRFGQGLGWDCDAIVDSMDSAREFLNEFGNHCGPVEYVAVGIHEQPVMLRWAAATKTLSVVATVQ